MAQQCGNTKTSSGNPCKRTRLPGFSACFAHLPEDEIPAAEEKFNRRRCSHRVNNIESPRYGEICANSALEATEPPRCEDHMVKAPPAIRARADRQIEMAARAEVGKMIAQEGVVVEKRTFDEFANPFLMLMEQAQAVMDWQDKLKSQLDKLNSDEWRYSGERTGEQIRGEVQLYTAQLKATTDMLAKIAKLNIEERLARINERQAAIIEMAIVRTLADMDLPLDMQAVARRKIVEHMASA